LQDVNLPDLLGATVGQDLDLSLTDLKKESVRRFEELCGSMRRTVECAARWGQSLIELKQDNLGQVLARIIFWAFKSASFQDLRVLPELVGPVQLA
jgi:hypothetical protein